MGAQDGRRRRRCWRERTLVTRDTQEGDDKDSHEEEGSDEGSDEEAETSRSTKECVRTKDRRRPNKSATALRQPRISAVQDSSTQRKPWLVICERISQTLLPAGVEGSEYLTNALSFQTVMRKLGLSILIQAPHSTLPDDINTVLQQPAIRNLSYQVATRKHFFASLEDGDKHNGWRAITSEQSVKINGPDHENARQVLTGPELRTVVATFVQLLTRFPGNLQLIHATEYVPYGHVPPLPEHPNSHSCGRI